MTMNTDFNSLCESVEIKLRVLLFSFLFAALEENIFVSGFVLTLRFEHATYMIFHQNNMYIVCERENKDEDKGE